MASMAHIWNIVTQNIMTRRRSTPSVITIPLEHVDCRAELKQSLAVDNDYFQVTINQLFLKHGRKWLTNIDPLVLVVSEFLYDKKEQEIPYIVGPGLVQQFAQKEPQGMLFRNEKVAGLHPYRGGSLTLAVVLCQVPVGSPTQKFLGVLERATKGLNLATVVNPYISVGKVILDGIDALLGLNDTKPLVGLRTTFGKQGGDPLKPSYFVLIDAQNVKPETLKVKNNQLLHAATERPYQDADYVLYSLTRAPDRKRDDYEQLPFYTIWELAVREATSLKEGSWDNAKANLIALLNEIYLSPDLTKPQALEIIENYKNELVAMHKSAIGIANLSDAEIEQINALDEVRQMARSILHS